YTCRVYLVQILVVLCTDLFFFFFSSRRRHTIFNCDWSSDVCSSDLFGWDRRDGRSIKNLPRLPGPVLQEFKIHSLLTVSFDQSGQPTGRVFLLNGREPFEKQDLAWLESIAQHIGPALENIFLLRHLRARAIEAERSRIALDLHDGILQTLLSIEIQ